MFKLEILDSEGNYSIPWAVSKENFYIATTGNEYLILYDFH
jgi:hypothetical protein